MVDKKLNLNNFLIGIVVVGIFIGLIVVAWNCSDTKIVSPDYFQSKEKYVRSITAYLKSKIDSNETDKKEILRSLYKDRSEVTKEFDQFNIHFDIASSEVILYICDNKNWLRYKDLSDDEILIENKFYSSEVPCPFEEK